MTNLDVVKAKEAFLREVKQGDRVNLTILKKTKPTFILGVVILGVGDGFILTSKSGIESTVYFNKIVCGAIIG